MCMYHLAVLKKQRDRTFKAELGDIGDDTHNLPKFSVLHN